MRRDWFFPFKEAHSSAYLLQGCYLIAHVVGLAAMTSWQDASPGSRSQTTIRAKVWAASASSVVTLWWLTTATARRRNCSGSARGEPPSWYATPRGICRCTCQEPGCRRDRRAWMGGAG